MTVVYRQHTFLVCSVSPKSPCSVLVCCLFVCGGRGHLRWERTGKPFFFSAALSWERDRRAPTGPTSILKGSNFKMCSKDIFFPGGGGGADPFLPQEVSQRMEVEPDKAERQLVVFLLSHRWLRTGAQPFDYARSLFAQGRSPPKRFSSRPGVQG